MSNNSSSFWKLQSMVRNRNSLAPATMDTTQTESFFGDATKPAKIITRRLGILSELKDNTEKLGRGQNSVRIVKELTNFHMNEVDNHYKISKRMKYCLIDAPKRAVSIN